ncbi:MAG: helix-turn-helix domain-containing protein [Proteobacteria bacterium]|nr:helix-turn-helix domain-containing protein [Pseudomonadota bacterium]
MLAEIGAVVARVRTRRGLSLTDLAKHIQGEETILARLEAGEPGVTTTQLDDLAQALDLDPQCLRRGEERVRPSLTVFLRHEGMQDFQDVDRAVLDGAIEQARILHELGVMLHESNDVWPGASFKRAEAPHDSFDAAAKHGYQLAIELRKFWGLPIEPLEDLRAIVEERLGIAILVRQLSTRATCAVKVCDDAAIVLSGGTRGAARVRGAIAHELCHILHDPDHEGVHVVLDPEHDRSTHANEQRARAFAAELLLPRAGLNRLLGVPRNVREQLVARDLVIAAMDRYGTSWPITANHLCNREFIDLELRVWLEALDAHVLSSSWSVSLPPVHGPSQLVEQRTTRAHERALITDGEARSALGIEAIDPLPWVAAR